ncbi:MAG TPA: 3-isopropylmalate dehydrogenase, partial [Chitinophagales bacterium]|nr:3-isopropylmalate dehydrogenase [Chitinophagales bacterium]
GDPKYDNDPTAKVRPEQGLLKMRSSLGLYANIRPVKSYDSLLDASPLKNDRIKGADFIVVRELISGIYFGKPRGRSEDQTIAYDTCVYTKDEILRITKTAFELAKNRKQKVTLLDKANVLATSRLWRETVTEYAKQFPEITLECNYIDSAVMEIITKPTKFDVILTENLFGDIISDEASVIAGSLGILPSASIGDKNALYEPIHGSYPQAAGKNIANPMATILSAAMLLENSFGMLEESKAIVGAVEKAINNNFVTEDINDGKFSTSQVGDKIVEFILS